MAVKEGAGPILDGVIVWYLGVPFSLAVVESDAAARRHGAASHGLAATEKAVFEVFYRRFYT